jgi:N utilization substance protein A
MEIIVPDDQLSLAIGRKGQNVRLASQLTGWRLDIHSESRIQEIKDKAWASLSNVDGTNEFLIQTLYNHGIRSAQHLLESDRSFLMQFPGMTDDNLDTILESAKAVAEDEKAEEARLRDEAEQAARAAEAGRKLQELIGLDAVGRMRAVRGVGETAYKQLTEASLETVEALADASVEDLAERAAISEKKAKQLKYAAMQRIKLEGEIRETAAACGVTVVDGVVRVPGHDEEVVESPASGGQSEAASGGAGASDAAPSAADAEAGDLAADTVAESPSEEETQRA